MPKFWSTSCATLALCTGSGSVGTAGTGRLFLACVPVGGPWLQGKSGSMKVLQGSLPACEKLSCASSSSDQMGPSHGEPCKHLCQSGMVLVHPSVTRGFGKLHQTKAEQISPFLLFAVYNPISNFHYLAARSSSGNQFSSKLSGWVCLDCCLLTVCVFPVPFQLLVGP